MKNKQLYVLVIMNKKACEVQRTNKRKRMRILFRKNGCKTYLVDEFRTSCKCF